MNATRIVWAGMLTIVSVASLPGFHATENAAADPCVEAKVASVLGSTSSSLLCTIPLFRCPAPVESTTTVTHAQTSTTATVHAKC